MTGSMTNTKTYQQWLIQACFWFALPIFKLKTSLSSGCSHSINLWKFWFNILCINIKFSPYSKTTAYQFILLENFKYNVSLENQNQESGGNVIIIKSNICISILSQYLLIQKTYLFLFLNLGFFSSVLFLETCLCEKQ